MAHPSAWSTVAGTGVPPGRGLDHENTNREFCKFKNLPNIYSGFKRSDAEDLYKEMLLFLLKFRNALEVKFPGHRLLRMFPIK
jgi:hypothetical protein